MPRSTSRRLLFVAGSAALCALIVFVLAPLYLMSRNPTIAVLAYTTRDSYPIIPAALASAYLTHGSYDPNTVHSAVGQPMFSFVCSAYGLDGFDKSRLLPLLTLLKAKGAELDARRHGYTPLLAAILANEPDLVEELLRLGADPATRVERPGQPYDGMTAVDFARYLHQNRTGERTAILRILERAA